MNVLTRSAIDRLGRSIRAGDLADAESGSLREMLAEYERFGNAVFADIVSCTSIARAFMISFSARDLKSMASIRDKLRRRPMRLSDMQDIAGCRIITASLAGQDELVALLERGLRPERIVDHRHRESGMGYRAVHLIVKRDFHRYEIQVRTRLQNDWAMLVESLVPVHGIGVKYGEGPEPVQRALRALSDVAHAHELRVREGQDSGFSLLPGSYDAFAFLLADAAGSAAVRA